MVTNRNVLKLGLAAGVALIAAASQAFLNPDILIERALNSPNFTIKYSGVAAAMVEMRLNGHSIGTQNLSPSKRSGEAAFVLDLLSLNDGDNEVEVRLYDKNGRLLESQKMQVVADDGTPSPIKLSGVKQGATVQGTIEIKAGFGKELRNAYVSFFVDEQFKSMTNAAPFSYFWDTTGDLNGWHDVQAWVVDESSVTYKTRKLRVFVNNPGGRTERRITSLPPVAAPAVKPPATNIAKPLANAIPIKNAVKAAANVAPATVKPAPTSPELAVALSGFKTITSAAVGLRKGGPTTPLTGNAKIVTPKSIPTKLANVKGPEIAVRNAANAASTIAVGFGTRIPDMGSYTVTLNGKAIEFDVNPRVTDGVPLAPVRHLLEADGGKVDWENLTKTMFGNTADGKKIVVKIGDRTATIDNLAVELEKIPFLENGRTIVPLSFIEDALQVDVEFDVKTGHVLITSVKNRKL